MKKFIFTSLGVLGVLYLVGVALLVTRSTAPQQTKAPVTGSGVFGLETRDTSGDNNATTTVTFLQTTDTASTTLAFKSDGAESIDLDLQLTASSSSSRLVWQNQFTNGQGSTDCVATPTACDWYSEDGNSVDTAIQITHGASALTHLWTPGVTTISRKNITITPMAAKFARVVFSVAGANASLYAKVVLKKPF